MKRRNVQQSFVGEPNPNQEGIEAEHEGDDAVEFEVTGGRIMTTVPAATSDDQVLQHEGYLSGDLTLEDGRRLSFEIQDGAVGAQWNLLEDHPGQGDVGLNTLQAPGGV